MNEELLVIVEHPFYPNDPGARTTYRHPECVVLECDDRYGQSWGKEIVRRILSPYSYNTFGFYATIRMQREAYLTYWSGARCLPPVTFACVPSQSQALGESSAEEAPSTQQSLWDDAESGSHKQAREQGSRVHYLRERVTDDGSLGLLSSAEVLSLALQSNAHEHAPLTQKLREMLTHASLPDLLRADIGELQAFLGKRHALQVKAVLELARRLTAPQSERTMILSPGVAAQLLMPDMAYLDHEELRVLILDTKNRVMANLLLYQGTLNSSVLRAAEVFRPAIARKASGILIAHNHPSGVPDPSSEDLTVTQQIVEAGKYLDIDVVDHIIIGHQCWVSIRERLHW